MLRYSTGMTKSQTNSFHTSDTHKVLWILMKTVGLFLVKKHGKWPKRLSLWKCDMTESYTKVKRSDFNNGSNQVLTQNWTTFLFSS